MRTVRGRYETWEALARPTAVAVGVFDGVHIGHRHILEHLKAQSLQSVVLTFEPHPAEVLAPGTNPRLITTIEERLALFEGVGIDVVAVVDLAEIRHLQPEEFVSRVLLSRLGAAHVVVGSDFQFGRDRAGDCEFLIESGRRNGFDVEVVGLIEAEGVISSSRIRGLIERGDVAGAALLLGSRYRLSGVVVPGDQRGKDLGFPTANLKPPDRKVIPGNGIYAVWADVGRELIGAAVNVGTRPTFGGTELLIEAHLLDFAEDLYGTTVTLEFVARLRPEHEFASVEELVEAMTGDVARVRRLLESSPVSG
ncbi:MAG TPA: bifunctional riboflavin kinase/FAD synthetase [Acidimicrobiia bacterium]|nr:bifunctional riboflavin kinase/FAD synthetase [Acidimicrobiia bacterium]